jgi:predicted AlkP superfamily pyrophosphatase or phosphodiesterase
MPRPVKFLRALLAAIALLALSAGARATADGGPILILISFDGFRWDYIDRFPTPNLHALAARGVRAQELIPSFPVLTFPNHYTIVTGLYPEHHGIVANTMRDPVLPDRFAMANDAATGDGRWWGGEPLWVTAIRQGRRSATMFWPGSMAEIRGVRPDEWRPFDAQFTADKRTAQVLEWLGRPDGERPSFVTLYFDDVDHAGHDFGPDSAELRDAVATLDRQLGDVVAGVRSRGLDERTTVVVVSDHGMVSLSHSREIYLDDYIDAESVDILESTGFLALGPRGGSAAAIRAIYSRLRGAHPHLRVYTRENMPARLHYRDNPRIAPIIGIPDAGWAVTTRARKQRRRDEGRKPEVATHGFDPADRVMHATFVAAGPNVREHVVVPPFENIQIYNFLCGVLGLKPAPNDGSAARVSAWFRRSP